MTLRYNKIIIPTLSTITGILWQYYGWSFFALLFLIPFFTIINFFYSKNYRQALAIFFISATLFSLGAFRLLNRQKQQNGFYKKYSNKELATIATIHDIKEIEGKFYKNCITIVAEKIKLVEDVAWQKIDKKIQLYVRTLPCIQVEDKIKITHITFKKPDEKFSMYLMKEQIAANIFDNKLNCEILKRPKISIKRTIFNKRNTLLYSIRKKMPKRSFAMFSSIFLGNRQINKKENNIVKNSFRLWGILHFLARSGLHLIIFLMLCELMLKFIPIHFHLKQGILVFLSLIYLLLSWPSLSFIRAFSIFLLYKLCPILNKKSDLATLVATVCLMMLIYNPIQLFFLDFQLSFGLTIALAIFTKQQTKRERKCRLKQKNYKKY